MLGAYRSTIGALLNPLACAIDKNDQIYIAESARHRIAVFSTSGKLIRTFGRKGSGDGELHFPAGLALGANGEVYVSDSGNHRICVFDRNGKFHRSWGGYGSVAGKMIRPAGLAVVGERVFVADTGNDRVQVFDLHGGEKRVIGGWGFKPGLFRRPVGVAIDNENRMYVLDRDNNRVSVPLMQTAEIRVYGVNGGRFPECSAARWGCACTEIYCISPTP
ncbi:MAG: NHL repeat-containing protein [Planctomycetes bacterium]|nr:NHL repeat-containing protein [Planctomycetota bacterium]